MGGRIVVKLRSKTIKRDLALIGLTQGELGDMIGLKRQYMSMLIRHERNPGPKLRWKIYRILTKKTGRGWHEIFEGAE